MTPTPPLAACRTALAAAFAAALVLALTGCATLPDIAAQTNTVPGAAPVLIPIDGILAQADAVGTGAAATATVSDRADALRSRADSLRRQ